MKRNRVRKLVFGLAIVAFVGAVVVLGLSIRALSALGGGHVATASLFATSFFLLCCGVVLYFMSLPPRSIDPGVSKHDA